MRQVRDLGRYPKESPNRGRTELQLAERLRRALNDGKLSPEHVAELQALRAKQKEYERRYQATPRGKARRKEIRRKYEATPHGKAKRKEYGATPHRKAYLKEYKRRYRASPHGKVRQKEYQRKYLATPHGKAKRKECKRKYDVVEIET